MTLRIGLLGATGAMGRHVLAVVARDPGAEVVVGAVREGSPAIGTPCGSGEHRPVGPGVFDRCDVVVDFSVPEALLAALPHVAGRPLVSGTTGLDAVGLERLQQHARSAPLLHAANFSVGVHVLLDLVQRAVRAMPDADVEIVEIHHRRKRDAPSGTALALGAAVTAARPGLHAVHGRSGAAGPRSPEALGYHAVRGGDVVGEHTVWLMAEGERVALQHLASSREVFASGAVRAARGLIGRVPGAYSMADVLGLGAA